MKKIYNLRNQVHTESLFARKMFDDTDKGEVWNISSKVELGRSI